MAEIPDDRFGPFKGQLIPAIFKTRYSIFLEKVGGEYQGWFFRFSGFRSGVNRLVWAGRQSLRRRTAADMGLHRT